MRTKLYSNNTNRHRFLWIASILFIGMLNTYAQGDYCIQSEPASTYVTSTYPAGVDAGSAEEGPDYGCLGSQPNPAWYYLQISVSGDIDIELSSEPQQDIDFILWGPYEHPHTPCVDDLTSSKIVDCSYSPDANENCYLHNAQLGEFYILMITNFSNQPCDISMQKTAGSGEANGTTIASNNSPICTGEDLAFYIDTFNNATYSWSGPNGFTSNLQNPQIQNATTAASGSYTCEVNVEDETFIFFTSAVVNDLPDVVFEPINPVCQNNGIILIDEGQPSGGVYSGNQINSAGYFDSNTPPGNYQLTYTYTDANSCSNSAQQSVYVVQEPQAATSVSVSINAYCESDAPGEIHLQCEGPDNSYIWYENDMNTSPIGNSKNIVIPAPTETTVYFVRSETSCGNSEALSITVTVYESPVADFRVDNVCLGNAAIFNDISTIGSGSVDNWHWDFGNGSFSTNQNPMHIYSNYGTYTVSLEVTSSYGCSDIITQNIEVFDNPTSSFEYSNTCLGETTQFTNTSEAPESNITSYIWEMDGTTLTDENPSFTFAEPGDYDVQLTVETEHVCSNAYSETITINSVPNAAFTYDNPCRSNAVEFTNYSSSGANGSPLESFLWDFNNGDTSNEFELTYIYPSFGNYNVSLTVTDENGCDNTFTENVHVSPDFDVAINYNPFCIGVEGEFDGVPIPHFIPMDNYTWYLPNGNIAQGEDIPYTFTEAGTYEISLVGIFGDCTAGETIEIEVKELPIADFSIESINNEVHFTNNSSSEDNEILNSSWSFGDGNDSEQENPIHSYQQEGNYQVSLEVQNTDLCISDMVQEVAVEFPNLLILPENQSVYHQQQFSTNIQINNIQDLGGFSFELHYNPDLIHATEFQLNDFITSSGRTLDSNIGEIDNQNGVLTYSVSTAGQGIEGVEGNGDLITINWEMINMVEENTTIELAFFESHLNRPNGTEILKNNQSANVLLLQCNVFDIDCDCDVDIVDISSAAFTYGTQQGDENYDSRFDYDNDGDIDIIDITTIAYNYNWACDN